MFNGVFLTPTLIILTILGCLRHDPIKKMCTTSEVYIDPGDAPSVCLKHDTDRNFLALGLT